MGARKLNWDEVDSFRKIRAMVVDNSQYWMNSVLDLLDTDEKIVTVGTASDSNDALAQMQTLRPDLVLMNLQMPEMNGLEVTSHARRKFPFMRVVLFTVCERPKPSLLKACEFSGVHALVTRDRMRAELLTEIQSMFGTAA